MRPGPGLPMVALALLLASCASQELAFSPSAVPVPPPEPPRRERPAKLVRIPSAALWLGETVMAQYRGLPARSALERLVPNGLLAFRLPQGEGGPNGPPVDYALPGKATRQQHIAAVCTAADWAWHIEEGVLVVTATETRTFQLEASPGQRVGRVSTAELDDTPTGAAGVERVVADSAHEQALAALRGAAAGTGASVDLVGSSGQIVVSARPSVMRRLAGIIEQLNRVGTRRVALEFVLYEVDVSDSETRALDVTALRDAAIGLSLSVSSPGGSALRDIMGDLSILWTDTDDRAFGTEVVFRWLKQQGETKVRIQKNVVAVHNQVTELQDVQISRYISEVTIQQQASGATSVVSPSVRTDSVKTGETWAVLPTIVGDRVSLRLASSRSELVALEEYSFSDDAVAGALPVTAVSSVSTPISLDDGETRVITNLSSSRERVEKTASPLLAWLPWLGEARGRDASSVETVITITADIL